MVDYRPEQRVWILNPYPRTRLKKRDERRTQGPPPYDDDSAYRARWLSARTFLRPIWVPAKVVSIDAASASCVCQTTGLTPTVEVMVDCSPGAEESRPLPMNTASESFDDLVDLPHLHAAALLHNIQARFAQDQIYTYAGPILLAVNPYQYISTNAPAWARVARLIAPAARAIASKEPIDIYHPIVQDLYARQQATMGNGASGMLPPHVFQVAKIAFDRLVSSDAEPHPQSVVISGESGAGKTATTKLVLNFLAEASALKRRKSKAVLRDKGRERRMSSAPVAARGGSTRAARRVSVVTNDFAVDGMSAVSTRILQSNHILEAFGNAKTVRNDNSSRFGKLIRVFLAADGDIVGSEIDTYLLEKVRVVSQSSGERNFHIFYMMLAGLSAEERATHRLLALEEYRYLTLSDITEVDGVDDALEFGKMRDAMLGAFELTAVQFDEVMRLIGGVLALGNITFTGDEVSRCDDVDALERAAFGLGIDSAELEGCLCTSVSNTRDRDTGELMVRQRRPSDAADARDALAKMVYELVFSKLVQLINRRLEADRPDLVERNRSLGILDIFGFENFDVNSFEQLCINYANEKLQQVFVHHVFELEKQLYDSEGIAWKELGFTFTDNKAVINLLEKKSGTPGIFPFLDEAVALPRATDATVFARLKKVHEKHPHFANPPKVKGQKAKQIEARSRATLSFVVLHSAAPDVGVQYYVKGFVEKNRDTLAPNTERALEGSSVALLRTAFDAKKGSKSKTVGGKFIADMRSLKKALTATEPHFIRCIKPNNSKDASLLSPPLVHHQLQYLGVLSSIEIRHSGFSYRVDFESFYRQFVTLAVPSLPYPPPPGANLRELCVELLAILSEMIAAETGSPIGKEHAQVGRTKIFFRNFMINSLESLREEHYRLMDAAALVLQTWWESNRQTNKFGVMRRSFTSFQAAARASIYRDAWQQHRGAVRTIQRSTKGFLARLERDRQVYAVAVVQDASRRYLRRRAFRGARRGVLALRLAARSMIARRHVLRVYAAVRVLQKMMRAWLQHFRNYWEKVRLCLLLQAVVRSRQWRRSAEGVQLLDALKYKQSERRRRELVRLMEQAWRSRLVQKRMAKMRDAAKVLQFWRRTIILRTRFVTLRDTLRMLQRVARGALARKEAALRLAKIAKRQEAWRIKTVREREAIQLTRANRQPSKREAALGSKKLFKLINVDVLVDTSEIFPDGWTRTALDLKRQLEKQGKHIASIACGASHSAAVTDRGELYTWGLGDRGQLGHGTKESEPRGRLVDELFYGGLRRGPAQVLLIKQVACGENHTVALTSNGSVHAWGIGNHGQLGCGAGVRSSSTPMLVGELKAKKRRIAQIACGAFHTAALGTAGSLYCWGSKTQVGLDLNDRRRVPGWNCAPVCVVRTAVGGSKERKTRSSGVRDRVLSVRCGLDYTAAVTHDGGLLTWGSNAYGQLGFGDREPRSFPQRVSIKTRSGADARITAAACGARHTAAIVATGRLFLWGSGGHGEQGLGSDLSDQLSPKICTQPELRHAIQVVLGNRSSVVLTEDYRLFAWGMVGCVPTAAATSLNPDAEEEDPTQRPTLTPTLVPYASVPGRTISLSSSSSHSYSLTSVLYNAETVETALRRQKRAEKRAYRSPRKAGEPRVPRSPSLSPGAHELAGDAADAIVALINREDDVLEREIAGAAMLASQGGGTKRAEAGDDLNEMSVEELQQLVLSMQAEEQDLVAPSPEEVNRARERDWKAEHTSRLTHHIQPATSVQTEDDSSPKFHSRYRDAYGRTYSIDARTRTDIRGVAAAVDAAAAAGAAAAARELQLSSSASRAASIALPVFAPPQAEEDDMLGNFSPALLVNASNPEYAVKKNVKPVTVIERLTADHARSLVGLPSDHVSEETKIESRGALALFRKAHPGLNRSTPDEYATEEEEEVGADLDAGSAAPRWSGRRGSAIERSHAAIEQQVWQPPSEYDETYISYDEGVAVVEGPRGSGRPVPPPPPPLTPAEADALFSDRVSRAAVARERRYNAAEREQRERDAAFEATEREMLSSSEDVLQRLRREASVDAARLGL